MKILSFNFFFLLTLFTTFILNSSNTKKRNNKKEKEKKKHIIEEKLNSDGEYDLEEVEKIREPKEDDVDFAEEWNRMMIDYDPDYTVTFNLPYLGKKVFFEEIESPTYISGGYLINNENAELDGTETSLLTRVKIISPNGDVILDKKRDRHLFLKQEITTKGKHTVIFQNVSKKPYKVTFTLEIGCNKPIKSSHMDKNNEMLEKITSRMKQLKSIFKFKHESNQERYKSKKKKIILIFLRYCKN